MNEGNLSRLVRRSDLVSSSHSVSALLNDLRGPGSSSVLFLGSKGRKICTIPSLLSARCQLLVIHQEYTICSGYHKHAGLFGCKRHRICFGRGSHLLHVLREGCKCLLVQLSNVVPEN